MLSKEQNKLASEDYIPSARPADFEQLKNNKAWQDIMDFIGAKIYVFRDELEQGSLTHSSIGLNTEDKVRGGVAVLRFLLSCVEQMQIEAVEQEEASKKETES